MSPESDPFCHEVIEDGGTLAPGQGDHRAVEEDVRADVSGLLTEPNGELYRNLARGNEDYRVLFGDASQVLAILPELGDVVASFVPESTVVANIPSFLQKLIDSGELTFQVDRSGDALAHLVDRSGRMRHVLRLDTRHLTPKLSQAWSNLRASAVQLEVVTGLRGIEDDVAAVRTGLQDDRLALVDSAWSLIDQAHAVSDSERRKDLLDIALSKADEAREMLARSIDSDLKGLARDYELGAMAFLWQDAVIFVQSQKSLTERNAERAERVVRSVAAMESATRAVALVHMHHGDTDAARIALGRFQDLLSQRQLNNDANVTALSSFAHEDQKPLYARVLSTHARAIEVCGMEPDRLLMPPPEAIEGRASFDEEEANVTVAMCSECGRDIEVGAIMCAYHRGRHRENLAKTAGPLLSVGVVAIPEVVKHWPKVRKLAFAAIKLIRR
ncbi:MULTISPECIES: hypothetical protein [unclassified Actinomyces]|uniref:hypothetical protein n=1 Tax=unclassified Actinomyces TaxID=2609248 RepID=UPI0015EBB392|nr:MULTISPECIES: hypothetical protein [unclassified Actinomyces]